ncbi:MAG: tRNA 4-thiouridine(8) synthase ThiI, partial [Firmicutes bacterium]|nr:tRNA 4-thiouridine(8) synthase ThiI [Bacillota bacterium]
MNERKILIVRVGEVALKGMNKPFFERMLAERIVKRLEMAGYGSAEVKRQEGLIFVCFDRSLGYEALAKEISKVFGVASISPAVEAEPDLDAIGEEAVRLMLDMIETKGVST